MAIVTGASVVNILADKTGKSKKEINETLRAVLAEIKEQLVSGNSVSFHDFGIFNLKTLAAREGHSFGKAYSTPERKTVGFKPSSSLKEALNS